MNQFYELELRGCTPDPLMAYLKALGIFRLVAKQKDPRARAWWQHDTFFLHSILDRDALKEFFLEEYRPTPIVTPWSGGSGFYPRDNQDAIHILCSSDDNRLQLYQHTILTVKKIKVIDALLKQFEEAEKVKGTDAQKRARSEAHKARTATKDMIMAQCRVQFPDDALDWLDAAYVITTEGTKYPPLFGSGGNDGRLDFSNNFMQNLVSALNLDKRSNGRAIVRSQITATLFNEGSPQFVKKRSTGFYNPSSVGGPNASVGFTDNALTNPWDYVLMFEGALMFAGAAARRLSSQASSKAVFPFTVDNSAAGYGTSVDSEYGDSSRAEFWVPLWEQPANLQELEYLVSEGRAQIGRRQVSSGTDFARAVSGLGTERGVSQFQRYGFLERNGQAYLAAPLGRFYVQDDMRDTAQRANVLFDLDRWLENLRRAGSDRNMPAGLGTLLRQIDQAIIEFCQQGQPYDLQNVLIAVGRAEQWLSIREKVYPLNRLSYEWIRHANDQSVEFRLAQAMASILHELSKEKCKVGPIRENLEPVDVHPRIQWNKDSTSFVWTAGDALSNMLAVLERRCLEGRMQSLKYPPLAASAYSGLNDIVEFLTGSVDVQRIADLALPLSFVSYRHHSEGNSVQQHSAPFDLSLAYAAMKLTLLPDRFVCPEFNADTDILMEPQMLAMLRAGRVDDAYRVAYRRLKASGLQPLSDEPGIANGSDYGRRLAAALLFPLHKSVYRVLAKRALRRPENETEFQSS